MKMVSHLMANIVLSFCLSGQAIQVFAADPIRIGLMAELTGPNVDTGKSAVNGASLAMEEINQAGGVLGHPLSLEIEDNQSSNPGSLVALSKIINRGKIAAIIGTIKSTQSLTMMQSLQKAGIPTLVGGTDYVLTHSGNPWLFRVRPHDGYSAKVMADFGINTLKRKKWAIVNSAEAFGVGGRTHLIQALKENNTVPVTVLTISENTQNFTPIIDAIKQSDADIISVYIARLVDVGTFVHQLRQAGVTLPLIGSPALASGVARRIANEALYDSYSVNDFFADASSQGQAYVKKYKDKYGQTADYESAWAYDAVRLLALAIKNAQSTKPEEIRQGMLAIQGYRGVESTYFYDQNGDGLHGYNIVRNDHGNIVFVKHVSFDASTVK